MQYLSHTYLTLTCLLNIGTKENNCILGRPTSFDWRSAAVGNNAHALLIHQGEREFLLEESSKEPPAGLFTDILTDWMTDWTILNHRLRILSYSLIVCKGLSRWHIQPSVHFRDVSRSVLSFIFRPLPLMTFSPYSCKCLGNVTALTCPSTAVSHRHACDIWLLPDHTWRSSFFSKSAQLKSIESQLAKPTRAQPSLASLTNSLEEHQWRERTMAVY